MAAPAIPYSATFTYGSFSGYVTGLAVDMPRAEIVNMTPQNAAVGAMVMVPTGAVTGGKITVDFWHDGVVNVRNLIGTYGTLTFSSAAYSVSQSVVCEHATMEARTGQIVSGTLSFVFTDFTG